MTFTRVKELEAQVARLQKELKSAEVDRMMMTKFLNEKGLIDEYEQMALNELRDVYAGMLRRNFKVVDLE